jgi:hypothetical protein
VLLYGVTLLKASMILSLPLSSLLSLLFSQDFGPLSFEVFYNRSIWLLHCNILILYRIGYVSINSFFHKKKIANNFVTSFLFSGNANLTGTTASL